MSNTIITENGLNAILSASDLGPFIGVKYFLPVYDYRADINVHNGITTSAIPTSAAMSESDTIPFGEKIWNIEESQNQYSLSDNNNYVISAGVENINDSEDPWILTNSVISKQQSINLYNNIPLSNQIYGENGVVASGDSNAWEIYSGSYISGDNSIPPETSSGTDRFFTIVDYYPSSADGNLKGTFKCRLSKNIGTVKFNKIGLYAISINSNGEEIGTPFLFAETMLPNTIIKTNFGTEGFDDIVIDVQLTISSVSSAWGDVFYSTSGDYWQRTINGLYYPENVGIGSFDEGIYGPQSKLHIRSNDSNHIILDSNNNSSTNIYLDNDDNLMISGDTEEIKTTSINPITNNIYKLGSENLQWENIYTSAIESNTEDISLKSNLIPSINNNYNLGDVDHYFNSIFTSDLILDNTLSAKDIIPLENEKYELGGVFNGFKSIRVRNIYSSYEQYEVVFHSSIIPNNDTNNGVNVHNIGTEDQHFGKIYGTSAIFNDIQLKESTYGNLYELGGWIDLKEESFFITSGDFTVRTLKMSRINKTVIVKYSIKYQGLLPDTTIIEMSAPSLPLPTNESFKPNNIGSGTESPYLILSSAKPGIETRCNLNFWKVDLTSAFTTGVIDGYLIYETIE